MYQYKNTRTGSIIRTHGQLTGGCWELLGTAKPTGQEKEQQAETTAAPAAETPASKPAATKPAATKPAAKTTTRKAASTGTKPAAKGKAK